MATIDLIVLGMLRRESMSAYEIQKLVEYRNISKWVRISAPSIYKKVLQLERKGLISSRSARDGRMPEKAVYTLTDAGRAEFERLMLEIASSPIHLFLDFNAVIVNLDSLPRERQRACLEGIAENVRHLRANLDENLARKEGDASVPAMGMAVLRQQLALAEAIDAWVASLREELGV